MTPAKRHGTTALVITFLVAMLLTIIPLPESMKLLRPEWTVLVLIYWCMAVPERMGVASAWMLGLLVDTLTGTLLGQHALSYSIIAYLILKLYQRLRLHPRSQQALTVLLLLLLHQGLMLWVNGVAGVGRYSLSYWLAPVIGMALWPLVFAILRGLRRGFRVT